MANPSPETLRRDNLLDEAVAGYLEAAEAGQAPDRQEWLARYPEVAAELAEFIDDQERVDRWTEPLRGLGALPPGFEDPLLTVGSPGGAPADMSGSLRDYELLEEIARGGMGVVYKARQLSLNRIVALKMILAGPRVSSPDLRRFRMEMQSAASLDHPHIIPIYDVDEYCGRPYFSMKLAEGGSLADHLSRFVGDGRAAARLLAAVARGVHHAHQRGILHRDLKPANILLDAQGNPYVTDFGLARRVEGDSGITQSGAIVGTPSFMAPEQAAGRKDLTTAADVYSLGAIFYALLTDRPPFHADTPLGTLRHVLEHEPSRPRLLNPRVDRDLETICLKCLDKQPQRRYGSAEAVAEDLERWLAGEPIRARRSALWERAVKRARRNPTAAALVVVSTLALLGLIAAGVVYQDHRARAAEQELAQERNLGQSRQDVQGFVSEAERQMAGGHWQEAMVPLEKALTEARDKPSMHELVDRAHHLMENIQRELEKQEAQLEAEGKYQEFMRQRNEVMFYGSMFTGVDLPANLEATRRAGEKALEQFGLSLDAKETLKPDPSLSAKKQKEIADGCYELFLILAEVAARRNPSEPKRAEQLVRRALDFGSPTKTYHIRLARYLEILGDGEGARREYESAQELSPASALDHFLLGEDARRRGDPPLAIEEFESALAAQNDHFWARFLLAGCRLSSEPRTALAHLDLCADQSPDFDAVYLLRGIARGQLSKFIDAEGDFQKALKLALPGTSRGDDVCYAVLVSRGELRTRQKKFPDALEDLQRAVTIKPSQYQALWNLAVLHEKQGNFDSAVDYLGQAIEVAKSSVEANDLEPTALASLLFARAKLNWERLDWGAALEDVTESIRHKPAAEAYVLQGNLWRQQGKHENAVAAYDGALAVPAIGTRQLDSAEIHHSRALSLLELGDFEEAVRSLDHFLAAGGKPDAVIYRLRGQAHANREEFDLALMNYLHALALSPNDSQTLAARGWVYLVRKALDMAQTDFERAIKADPKNGDAYCGLAHVQVARRDDARAVANAEEGVRLGPAPLKPRLLFTAARVYGFAVTVKEDERRRSATLNIQPQVQYRNRALELLREGMEMLPEPAREGFWKKSVRPDYLLPEGPYWQFRNSPGFQQLAARYEQPAAGESSP